MAVYTGKKLRFVQNGDEYILDASSIQTYEDAAHFPVAGESGLLYVAIDSNYVYRWDADDLQYVQIGTVDVATQSTNGLMSAADKTKLDGIASGAQVNPGDATQSSAGLMSAADKTKLDGVATGANKYSLPLAANGTRGGVQVGFTQSGKDYPVQLSSEKMYVNVPWTDTNTWRGIQNNLTSTSTTDSLSAAQGKNLADNCVKSISRSSTTFTATRYNGGTFTFTQQDNDTNTWRGIQNNLTSTSTTESLSAAQGKALHDKLKACIQIGSGSTGTITLSENMTNFIWVYVTSTGYMNYIPTTILVDAWATNATIINSNTTEASNYCYSIKRTANNKIQIVNVGAGVGTLIFYGVTRR